MDAFTDSNKLDSTGVPGKATPVKPTADNATADKATADKARAGTATAGKSTARLRLMASGRTAWSGAAPALVLFVLVVAVWEAAARLFHIPLWMLPPPHLVLERFVSGWKQWLYDSGVTLLESVLGFGLGSAIGIGVGILFAHSRPMERALYPYAILLKSIPIIALAPVLTIWFGTGLFSKVLMAAVITFFPCIVNTVMGLRSPSRETVELMHSLYASTSQIFWKLRAPSALPSIFSALKISSTLAVIGAIVAEMAGPQAGLGYELIEAQERTDMVTMITAVVLTSIAGILFFGVVSALERRFLYWQPQSEA